MEDRPPSDAELVTRATRGDASAYEEIVRRYETIAFRTAWVITGSAADAEEAAQDGFVKAHRALGRFREGAPLRPWLLTIVANEARNLRRGAGRRAFLALRVSVASGLEALPSAEEAVLASERRAMLLAAVDTLPAIDRDVISCRYLAGLSEAETAAALGCRLGTVKSRSSRGLARLRVALEAGAIEPGEGTFHG